MLAAIVTPLVALALRPYLVPESKAISTMVSSGIDDPKYVYIDAYWEHLRGSRSVSLIIVRPCTVGFSSARHRPDASGISVTDNCVYLDGAKWPIQHRPCFLVMDDQSRTLHEVRIGDSRFLIRSHADVIRVPEWKSQVLPILEASRRDAEHVLE